MLALSVDSELLAGVVGWTDLTAPGVADALDALRQLPGGGALVGIRHQAQDEPDPDWLIRPDVLRGIAAVGAAGLVYDLLAKPDQLPAAVAVAAALPDVTFVLDHLGKPDIAGGGLRPWADVITRLAALPNTVAKLSGLVTEAAADWRPEDLQPYADTVRKVRRRTLPPPASGRGCPHRAVPRALRR